MSKYNGNKAFVERAKTSKRLDLTPEHLLFFLPYERTLEKQAVNCHLRVSCLLLANPYFKCFLRHCTALLGIVLNRTKFRLSVVLSYTNGTYVDFLGFSNMKMFFFEVFLSDLTSRRQFLNSILSFSFVVSFY